MFNEEPAKGKNYTFWTVATVLIVLVFAAAFRDTVVAAILAIMREIP